MAIRTGMQNLVDRVRGLTGAGTAEYTAGTVSYWTDEDIEDVLDSNVTLLIDSPLTWLPQTFAGGTVNWLISQAAWRDLEEDPGTASASRFVIRTSAGSAVGTANYSTDYRAGRVTFTSSQGGTAYFLTAYSYDVHAAAADVWEERLAHFQDWYKFSADNQSFDRQQAFDHAEKMLAYHRGRVGANELANAGGDVRFSQMVRVDIA